MHMNQIPRIALPKVRETVVFLEIQDRFVEVLMWRVVKWNSGCGKVIVPCIRFWRTSIEPVSITLNSILVLPLLKGPLLSLKQQLP
jgi:hypothetical protein